MDNEARELIESVRRESVLPELREGRGVRWHLGADADEGVGKTYRALVGLKSDLDRFEEIPEHLMPLYRAIMKAIDVVAKSRRYTTQVREVLKRQRLGV